MITFPWYKEIQNSSDISQGDIIFDCQILLPEEESFRSLLEYNDEKEGSVIVKTADLIILSQS